VSTVRVVARRDLGRRWRRVLVVIVLVGIVGAFTLAMAAGARRTSSALERFKQDSRSADVELAASPSAAQLEELSHAPGVAAMADLVAYGVIIPAAPDFQSIGAPVDGRFGDVIDRDRLVAGRSPDPAAPDEITIGEGLAARLGLAVGDHLDVDSYSPAQIQDILGGAPDVGPAAGPQIRLQVVGIVRRPLDLGERTASGGLMVLSRGFEQEYGDRVGAFGSRIRLRTDHGVADVPEVVAASKRILGDSLFIAQGLAVDAQGASNAIDVLALALWIGAGVAALAGAFTIGIVLTREVSLVSVDLETLHELGCDRRQLVAVSALPGLLIAAGGALLAGVLAVAVSPLFPFGVARRADPTVGLHADWTVLVLGVVAVVLVVLVTAFVVARRATRWSTGRASTSRPARTSVVAERVAAAGLAPPVASGVRMALEPGRGRTAVPVRTAFVGAVVGVLGVTAVLVFSANVDHLAATPGRYGAPWDFKVGDITSNTPCGAGDFGLGRQAGIVALAEVCSQNVQVDGRLVGGMAFTQLEGDAIEPEVTAGRPPAGPHEVALGAKTLRDLGKHVGDEVEIAGRNAALRYRIVGQVVLPTLLSAQPLADGAAFTGDGYAPLFDQNLFNRSFVGRFSTTSARSDAMRRIDAIPELSPPVGPIVPVEVDRLHGIDWLPATLAVLLGGLAVLAVGHALVTGVRRRRRDLALLMTLGFDRRQLRATVAWQATTLGLIGLIVGLPLGIVVGGLTWRAVADSLGVAAGWTIPLGALAATTVLALFLVNAIAFLPARAAASCRPAVALRSE
jgi:putative ABC transport system permease protein